MYEECLLREVDGTGDVQSKQHFGEMMRIASRCAIQPGAMPSFCQLVACATAKSETCDMAMMT